VIEAIAFQDGKFWVIDIPALDGMTQALRRDEIELMAFDFYECETDQKADPSNFKFTILEGEAAKAYAQMLDKRFEEIDLAIDQTSVKNVS